VAAAAASVAARGEKSGEEEGGKERGDGADRWRRGAVEEGVLRRGRCRSFLRECDCECECECISFFGFFFWGAA